MSFFKKYYPLPTRFLLVFASSPARLPLVSFDRVLLFLYLSRARVVRVTCNDPFLPFRNDASSNQAALSAGTCYLTRLPLHQRASSSVRRLTTARPKTRKLLAKIASIGTDRTMKVTATVDFTLFWSVAVGGTLAWHGTQNELILLKMYI